jgi:hypothetical protein
MIAFLLLSMMSSEYRFPLFRIMPYEACGPAGWNTSPNPSMQ